MMKSNNLGKLALTLLIVLTLFTFTSCEWLLDVLVAPVGYVYDAKTGEQMTGVTVTLTPLDGTTTAITTSTGTSNGYYTFLEGISGTCELTASATGYTFTKQIVEVTGIAQTLPNIIGFEPGSEVFNIAVVWDEGFSDVDAYLSMPRKDFDTSATVDYENFYESSDTPTSGFFPIPGEYTNGVDATRQTLFNGATEILDNTDVNDVFTAAVMDRDDVGGTGEYIGGPETMSIYGFPFAGTASSPAYSPIASDNSGLDTTQDYVWVGTMEYWLDAYDASNPSSTTFDAADPDALLSSEDAFNSSVANPVVYIFDANGQKGYFELPDYMDIKTASVIRINLFYGLTDDAEYFQFLPDVRVYGNSDSIERSLSSSDPLVIKGNKRR